MLLSIHHHTDSLGGDEHNLVLANTHRNSMPTITCHGVPTLNWVVVLHQPRAALSTDFQPKFHAQEGRSLSIFPSFSHCPHNTAALLPNPNPGPRGAQPSFLSLTCHDVPTGQVLRGPCVAPRPERLVEGLAGRTVVRWQRLTLVLLAHHLHVLVWCRCRGSRRGRSSRRSTGSGSSDGTSSRGRRLCMPRRCRRCSCTSHSCCCSCDCCCCCGSGSSGGGYAASWPCLRVLSCPCRVGQGARSGLRRSRGALPTNSVTG